MKIDFNKHSDEDIMDELVLAKLFASASYVKDKYPDRLSQEDLDYQNKVFEAYAIVLGYMTNNDKRMKMFKDVL